MNLIDHLLPKKGDRLDCVVENLILAGKILGDRRIAIIGEYSLGDRIIDIDSMNADLRAYEKLDRNRFSYLVRANMLVANGETVYH